MEKQTSRTGEAAQKNGPIGPLPAPPSDSPSTGLALIERVTLDPSADVQKLERLTAMYYRLKAKEPEFAYHAAKGRILKKLAGVPAPAD